MHVQSRLFGGSQWFWLRQICRHHHLRPASSPNKSTHRSMQRRDVIRLPNRRLFRPLVELEPAWKTVPVAVIWQRVANRGLTAANWVVSGMHSCPTPNVGEESLSCVRTPGAQRNSLNRTPLSARAQVGGLVSGLLVRLKTFDWLIGRLTVSQAQQSVKGSRVRSLPTQAWSRQQAHALQVSSGPVSHATCTSHICISSYQTTLAAVHHLH
ncbi:hypothetical protein F5B21DRAFT_312406 [Xylaria acuta]|nr:hypothetical protein F5B21DRAFT_312406 [Xylaria acuta]